MTSEFRDNSDDDDLLTLYSATAEDAGQRLDKWLASQMPDLSRSRVQALLVAGQVSLAEGTITDASHKVKPGQVFSVRIPPDIAPDPEPQNIPLTVVYEDEHLIVVDKPAGLVVHPAAGHWDGTLVNALLYHCGESLSGIGGVRRPGIVHRLDQDTSGLLVAAKNDRAHQGLAEQFAAHSLQRAYRAVVWGVPSPAAGEISGNIGRSPHNRKKMAVVNRGGKPALTRYRLEQRLGAGQFALIECRLATGRTHQIRVHMTTAGHPLVGDPVYGNPKLRRLTGLSEAQKTAVADFPRQALHAWQLGFIHPCTQEAMLFTSHLPSDMASFITVLDC